MNRVDLGDENSLNLPVEDPKVKPFGKPAKDIKTPAAFKPGLDLDNDEVEVTSDVLESPNPNWDEILEKWGYDPEIYQIVEPVKVSQWEQSAGEEVKTLYSYKASVKSRTGVRDLSYRELIDEIKKFKPPKVKTFEGNDFFVVNLADWQLAKADGYGTVGTVNAILAMKLNVLARIRELRKIGRPLGTLVVVGLGDMVENCANNYSSQTYTVEMNRREQIRVARRLIRDCFIEWAPHFNNVIASAVPGNHGENRNGGKQPYTTPGDNDDVAVFEMAADILSFNSAFDHVKFFLPENDISVTLDIGVPVCFVHGHITNGTGNAQQKLKSWWSGQAFGEQGPGSAKILVSGHYHHFSVVEYGPKIHLQCPAMDGGSEWFQNNSGLQARPGTLTFRVDENGYSDIQVI